MVRWEYNTIIDTVNSMSESVAALDEAGRDGWEVIAVTVNSYGITYLMKKQLPGTEAAKSPDEALVKHNHSIENWCRRDCPWFGTANQVV